jgi:tetratricopeptide (TPR) repeat protein
VLERTVNARVRMLDERTESLARTVLMALTAVHMASGNVNEVMRSIAMQDQIDVPAPQVISSGVVAHVYRFADIYLDDTGQAIEEINTAIDLDPGNPLLYTWRSGAHLREGLYEDAARDARTASRLGPDGWTCPPTMLSFVDFLTGDLEAALSYADRAILSGPDDWFEFVWRGSLYYFAGEYKLAKADFDRSIALGPKANYPYVFATLIALREGRVADASSLIETILIEFPDPTHGHRVLIATFGDTVPNFLSLTYSAFGNLILLQYEEAVEEAEAALAINDRSSGLCFMQGFAYCNLGNYAAAEAAYTRGLEIDPSFVLLHLLRAEVRLRQNDMASATEDLNAVRDSDQGDVLGGLVEAAISGELSCESLFSER